MAEPGGYRKPNNPATTSGPGRLSRRTDGGPGQPIRELGDPAYGEQQTFREAQQSAPMASTPGGAPGQLVMPANLANVTPLSAPTARPGEPVTSGAPLGAGPGPAAAGIGQQRPDPGWQRLINMLPSLELMASLPDASDAFRDFVRRIRSMS